MASPIIQIRRGPAANLGFTTLRAGEPGFTTDKYELFVGTGNTITLGINTVTSELITAPDNKFFGSANYWQRETATNGSGVNLLTNVGGGDGYITIAAPNSLIGNQYYTLPSTILPEGFLQTDSGGTLIWTRDLGDLILGDITVGLLTATDNVYFSDDEDSTYIDNGAVVIDGGVGIQKSVNIGGNFYVAGVSTFIGEVTFQGGTINLGDQDTDDVIVGGEFASNLGPSTTSLYDIGSSDKQWRNVYAESFISSGISTIGGFLDVNDGLDVTGPTEIDDLRASGIATISGSTFIGENLTVVGFTTIGGDVIVSGASTFSGAFRAQNDVNVEGSIDVLNDLNITGFSTFGNFASFEESVSVSGSVNISQDFSVVGLTTLQNQVTISNGGIDVTGHTEIDSLNVTGVATFINNVYMTDLNVENEITGSISTARTINTTETTDDGDYYVTFTDDSTSQFGETLRVSLGASFNPNTKTFASENLKATTLKAIDGTSAITIAEQTGNIGLSSNLTIAGDLFVLGTSVEVNAESLKVEDSLIEVGLVNTDNLLGAPTSDLNIDVGILLHWYDTQSRKAATFWDDSASRIVLASDVSESSSIITVNNYAAVELGELWVNDTYGQSAVISDSGSERVLTNITVDGGTF